MKKNYRFTVAISAFNIEGYIQRAIDSVINQNFSDFELIVVDDCSTDNTYNIIKSYSKLENFKILKTKKNSGTAAAARNIAIENSSGEYMIFLDGDDTLYDNNTLENINNIISDNQYDIVYLGYVSVTKGNITDKRLSTSKNSTKEARLLCDTSFSVSSKCWNMKFIKDNNMKFKEGLYYEDELFSITGNLLAEKTTYGEFPIFKYFRNREGSVMTKPTIKKCSDWYRMLAEVIELYEIAKEEDKKYFLSFIKNENDSIPKRLRAIIEAMEERENIKVLPPRKYEFVDFFSDN